MLLSCILACVICLLCEALATLIFVEAIMSWFVSVMPYWLKRIYDVLTMVTAPVLMPFRRAFQTLTYSSGIDLSPIFAILVLHLISKTAWILLTPYEYMFRDRWAVIIGFFLKS